MKMLGTSVYMALQDYSAGTFKGGVSVTLDVKVDGVGLPEDFTRFSKFTEADYDAIFDKLVKNTDKIAENIIKDKIGDKAATLADLKTSIVKVTEVK